MAKFLWESEGVLVNFLPIGTKVNFDLYWKFLSQVKCQKRYLSTTNPGHLQVCIPQRPLGNSAGRFCRNYPTMLISHLQIFTCLFAQKTAHEDNIMRYRRHFRRPFVVVAKEWVQLLPGRVQGWKKTRKKMGKYWKITSSSKELREVQWNCHVSDKKIACNKELQALLFLTRLTRGCTVQGSNPCGGEIFGSCPHPPWGPPSLLYNGYRVSFPGVELPGRGVDNPPPSRAEFEERVELYLYSPSGPTWFILGWNLLPY